MKESENQKQIIAFLEEAGFEVWPSSSVRAGWGNRKGIPDLLVAGNGVTFLVEVKSSTGKLREEQIEFMDWWNDNGGRSIMAREASDVFDKLIEWGVFE